MILVASRICKAMCASFLEMTLLGPIGPCKVDFTSRRVRFARLQSCSTSAALHKFLGASQTSLAWTCPGAVRGNEKEKSRQCRPQRRIRHPIPPHSQTPKPQSQTLSPTSDPQTQPSNLSRNPHTLSPKPPTSTGWSNATCQSPLAGRFVDIWTRVLAARARGRLGKNLGIEQGAVGVHETLRIYVCMHACMHVSSMYLCIYVYVCFVCPHR